MPPAENIIGAALVGGSGYYLGSHMALTARGGAMVRWLSALLAVGILAAPYIR